MVTLRYNTEHFARRKAINEAIKYFRETDKDTFRARLLIAEKKRAQRVKIKREKVEEWLGVSLKAKFPLPLLVEMLPYHKSEYEDLWKKIK